MTMETKRLAIDAAQIRIKSDSSMRFEGYASVFGGVDSYGDTIDAKAFDETVKRSGTDRQIRMRWNHFGPVIGKWLEVTPDSKGLYVAGELTPGHSTAQDVYALLKHGAVDGLSIGYIPKSSEELGKGRRLLKEIDLVEISVVEEPADGAARIADVKSMIDAVSSFKEIETLLREAGGFSRSDATAVVGRIKSMAHGEREAEIRQVQEFKKLFGI